MPSGPGLDDTTRITMALIERCRAGDPVALDDLFTRYYPRVKRIVRVRLGEELRRRVESDDLVQETFLSALGGIEALDVSEPAEFVGWLSVLVENRIRKAARRLRAARRDAGREEPLGTAGGGERGLAASGTQPPDAVARTEREAVLDDCVALLPGDWRDVLILRDYEGGSWEHVARRLQRSVGAVQMLHLRAREKLREDWLRRGLDPPEG